MNKPRIRKWRGVWCCFEPRVMDPCRRRTMGYGYTPAAAYADWWQLTRRIWLEAA